MTGRTTREGLGLAVGALCLTFSLSASAQVQTDTTTTHGPAARTVQVESAQVVYVTGNDLFLKMQDGTIRHLANVPESARVDVGGKELGIHELKPGMTLHKTIVTTTTPKVITTTKSVTGKVWHVQPPTSVILTLDDGTNQEFKIPKGQKFNVNGQMTDAWGLKKGMMVSATKVVEEPITQVQREEKLTGTMPPAPPPPSEDAPILVVVAPSAPAAAPAVAENAPPALPKTGSELPLLGLLGAFTLFSGLGLRLIRKAEG
jgi:LPXTG-motif cell wall-anchored protein